MNYKTKLVSFLLVGAYMLFGCSGDDGEGNPGTFGFTVYDGEYQIASNDTKTIEGATVAVYNSYESWVNGDSPIKTFTTGANGVVESDDIFPSTVVVFAESGNYDNWPLLSELISDPNIAGRLSGSATVYRTLLSEFQNISNKSYLISDVLLNGTSTFNVVSDCSKDNTIQLSLEKTFVVSEGTNICTSMASETEYELTSIPYSASLASTTTINGNQCYDIYTDWSDANNYLYVQTDFNKIYTKAFTNEGEQIVEYTLQ